MATRAAPAPDFSRFRPVDLRSLSGDGAARLVRADDALLAAGREALVGEVTRICNEPLVYDILFRDRLRGAPYPRHSAEGFLDRAARGWLERTHFVFLILTAGGAHASHGAHESHAADGALVGNVEIESPDLETAEIGYWATARRRGFMTPAVAAVCDAARAAGYRSLHARTRPDNERSAAVLRRAGFEEVSPVRSGDHSHRKFVRILTAH